MRTIRILLIAIIGMTWPGGPEAGPPERFTLDVPENHADPGSRRITLSGVILRATGLSRAGDPLVFLAGGPGQAASESAGFVTDSFAAVRAERDIVLIDQRGTGGSASLALPVPDGALLDDLGAIVPPSWLRGAAEELSTRADLRCYATAAAVEDLELVRRALGAETINLYATSYGTRVGFEYIRKYGGRVRCAVFKSAAPLWNPRSAVPFIYGAPVWRTLDRVFSQIEADPRTAAAFPDLRGTFISLTEALNREPARVPIDVGGKPVEAVINGDAFALLTRQLLMAAGTRAGVPRLIVEAREGRLDAWAATAVRVRSAYAARLSAPMAVGVVAAEDAHWLSSPTRQEAYRDIPWGHEALDAWIRLIEGWPAPPRDPSLFMPLRSEVPALFIAGDLDPATPPEWSRDAAQGFSRSVLVEYRAGAHTFDGFPGVDRVIAAFLHDPRPEAVHTPPESSAAPVFEMPP